MRSTLWGRYINDLCYFFRARFHPAVGAGCLAEGTRSIWGVLVRVDEIVGTTVSSGAFSEIFGMREVWWCQNFVLVALERIVRAEVSTMVLSLCVVG